MSIHTERKLQYLILIATFIGCVAFLARMPEAQCQTKKHPVQIEPVDKDERTTYPSFKPPIMPMMPPCKTKSCKERQKAILASGIIPGVLGAYFGPIDKGVSIKQVKREAEAAKAKARKASKRLLRVCKSFTGSRKTRCLIRYHRLRVKALQRQLWLDRHNEHQRRTWQIR